MPVAPIKEIQVRRQDDGAGAIVSFPYDANLVERFRSKFPRARWDEGSRAWVVPGTTAERRVVLWLQHELSEPLAFADERGRDAFVFDPIESHYLIANGDLVVRTPYSRTVIEELRTIPWAAWNADERAWRVPYRSLEALRERWPAIETAARRAEPGERKRRREEQMRSPEFAAIRELATERRRKRLPLPSSALPPFGRPVMTAMGIVAVTGSDGEIADLATIATYPVSDTMGDYVWVFWRSPTLDELVRAWPARRPPDEGEQTRGWWLPTLEELRAARRKARSIERAAATRAARTV